MKREDFIQIGMDGPHKATLAECIRLYNAVEGTFSLKTASNFFPDAKMSEQSNNLVLYCHLPGEQVADCYYPVFLRERTVNGKNIISTFAKTPLALKIELAQKLRLDPNSIGPILNSRKTTRTPGAMINVMVTDDMVASFKSESSYKVTTEILELEKKLNFR